MNTFRYFILMWRIYRIAHGPLRALRMAWVEARQPQPF